MRGNPHGEMPPPDLKGVDEHSSAAFQALRHAMRVNGQLLHKIMAEKGAHPGQAVCVRMLAAHDAVSQRDLAEMLHLSRPTVTAMLQKMEGSGIIERWSDAEDQRLTRVRLTEHGRELDDELRSAHAAFINETIGEMSVTDRDELTRLLTILAEKTSAALARRA